MYSRRDDLSGMTSPTSVTIELRPATASDVDAISHVMTEPPEPPSAALLGAERASRFDALMVRAGVSLVLSRATVAVVDGRVVGVVDCGGPSAARVTTRRVLTLLPRAIPIVWPVLPRALQGLWVRSRVQFDAVPEAFEVAQLHVDEAVRNRGIGGRLLHYAEQLARGAGFTRMYLETGITNPARRLYERHGYAVVATKADATYERLTGSPGRILMVKDLADPPADQQPLA